MQNLWHNIFRIMLKNILTNFHTCIRLSYSLTHFWTHMKCTLNHNL